MTAVSYADCHKRSREQLKRENNCGAEEALFRLPRQVRVGKTAGKCHTGVRLLFSPLLSTPLPPRPVLLLLCYLTAFFAPPPLSFYLSGGGGREEGVSFVNPRRCVQLCEDSHAYKHKTDLCERQTQMHVNVGH